MNVVTAPARDIPRTTAELAMSINTAELNEFLAVLRSLEPGDWAKPTDCAGWTVHDLVAHVVGQFEGAASILAFLRRHRVGHRRYPDRSRLDAMVQQQIDDLGPHSPEELVERLAVIGPKAVRAMRRTTAVLKRMSGARMFPEDPLPDPTLGYIFDVIAARDTWMHRVDLTRATGRLLVLGEHDREVVAQVVRDLGLAWSGPSVVLELTGPAGGRWGLGSGSPVASVRVDAVGYLRTLSGRCDDSMLEVDGDREVAGLLRVARVVF
jgi:uncharacterized protein (TIGR03083 family)